MLLLEIDPFIFTLLRRATINVYDKLSAEVSRAICIFEQLVTVRNYYQALFTTDNELNYY